jgi:hypothetical protein
VTRSNGRRLENGTGKNFFCCFFMRFVLYLTWNIGGKNDRIRPDNH